MKTKTKVKKVKGYAHVKDGKLSIKKGWRARYWIFSTEHEAGNWLREISEEIKPVTILIHE